MIDLSKASDLKNVVFRVGLENVGWVTRTLQTVPPEHQDLQQISICIPRSMALTRISSDIMRFVGEAISGRCSDLDRLLVKFWESRSIRPKVGCERLGEKQQNMDYCIGRSLPEITKRGIVDPI